MSTKHVDLTAVLPFAGTYPEEALYPSEDLFPGEPRVEAGAVTRQVSRETNGALSFSGSLGKSAARALLAAVGFIADLVGIKSLRLHSGRVNPRSRVGVVNPGRLVDLRFPSPGLYPGTELFPSRGRRIRADS